MDSQSTEFLLRAVDIILGKIIKISSKILFTEDRDEARCLAVAMETLCEVLEEIEVLDKENAKEVLESIAAVLLAKLDIDCYPHLLVGRIFKCISHLNSK